MVLVNAGSLTFAHELGHNMGSDNDSYQVAQEGSSGGFYSYSNGYVNVSENFYTIMVYNTECAHNNNNMCTQIPYFSNPDVSYNGHATGSDSANNTKSLNKVSSMIARFQESADSGSENDDEETEMASDLCFIGLIQM